MMLTPAAMVRQNANSAKCAWLQCSNSSIVSRLVFRTEVHVVTVGALEVILGEREVLLYVHAE